MDWTTSLKAQQKDFYSRFSLGNLFHCDEKYLHSEVVFINEETVEKIKVESILESEEIANRYDLTCPLKEVLETIFFRKLGIEAFLSRFGHLTWLDNNKYHESPELSLVNSHFLLKKATQNKILLKTFHGEHSSEKYKIFSQEIENNNVIVFSFCPDVFKASTKVYQIIFLGFIPVDFIQKKNKDIFFTYIADLLYVGGFNFYLDQILPNNYHLLKRAKQEIIKGNYQDAILFYNRAINDNHNHRISYFFRAICKYRLGHIQEALKDLDQVIDLCETDDLAYHWRGYLHQELGNYSEALNNYNKELEINHLNYFVYFNRAIVYTKLNQFINALEDYSTAIQINKYLFYGYYNRAYIYDKLGDKNNSIEDYLKALKIKPNLTQAYQNLAIIYQQQGDYKEALKYYRLAIKTNPQYIPSYYNLAILLADLGQYQQSINTYQIILKIAPDFFPANLNKNSLSMIIQNEGSLILKNKNMLLSSDNNPAIIGMDKESKRKNYSQKNNQENIDIFYSKQTNRFPLK